MRKNYFRPGSKSFKVIELLNEGKTYDEATEIMKFKNKQGVYNIVTRWKHKKLLNEKTKPTTETQTITNTEETTLSPPESQTVTVLPPLGTPQKRMDDMGKNIVQIEGFAPSRYIALTPKNITLIQWFTAKFGYTGDISDFINDAIEDFFQSRNYQLKVIKEEILQ